MGIFDWPPKTVPGRRAALRDVRSRDAAFRRNAAVALGRAEGDDRRTSIEALAPLLDDNDRGVRIEAISSLSVLGDASLEERIALFLESTDEDERVAALEYIAQTGSTRNTPAIEAMLEEKVGARVQCAALETLACISPERCRLRIEGILDDVEGRRPELVHLAIDLAGDSGEPGDSRFLAPLLRSPSAGVRLRAAHALALSAGAPAAELEPVLLDGARGQSDALLKEMAVEGLVRIGTEGARALASRMLGSIFTGRRWKVYWAALCAAGGMKEGSDYLARARRGRNRNLAGRAVRAAGLASLESWVPLLEENVRRSAAGGEYLFLYESIAALGLMRAASARDALARLEKDLGPSGGEVAAALRAEIELAGPPRADGGGAQR